VQRLTAIALSSLAQYLEFEKSSSHRYILQLKWDSIKVVKASGKDHLEKFEQLFHAYHAKLHRYAYTLLKDNEAAGDIVQVVFKKLWEKRDELLMEDAIKGYLYKATHNLCLNSIRDQKVRDQHLQAVAFNTASMHSNARDKVMLNELTVRIQAVTESLPPQCRLVFIKSRIEGKKYAEIASELNISVKTVEVQIGKALKVFRSKLGDYLSLLALFISIRS